MSENKVGNFKSGFIKILPPILIVAGILVAVAIVTLTVFFVIESQQNAKLDDATTRLEKIDELHADYLSASETASKETIQIELQKTVDEIAALYPNSYYLQRGHYLLASITFEKKDYPGAETQFLKTVDIQPQSYLSAIALFNAAVSAENSQKIDVAISYLERISTEYKKVSPEIPRALMNTGRLYEEKLDFVKANLAYQRIVDEFPTSSWTKIARDRIIYLKTQSKI